jgi:peptide/nickel transport system permease protein
LDVIRPALLNSLKLAVYAFVLVVPFGILGGVLSGLRVGKATDRGITIVGLSLAVVPEFVTGLVLILVFSIWAGWLPVTAQWDPAQAPWSQVQHLTLPAIALTLVLFGYVARITRAGVVEALDADYTRTAFLKGLPERRSSGAMCCATRSSHDRGHRDAGRLPPRCGSSPSGSFQLPRDRADHARSREAQDYTVLSAGVLIIGFTFVVVTLVADVLSALLNPRIRFEASE